MDYTEKIKQNQQEQQKFALDLHNVIQNNIKINKPLRVGTTPNLIAVCGANSELDFTISKSVIDK